MLAVNTLQDGATPLLLAAAKGHAEVVRQLLAHPQINVNRSLKVCGMAESFQLVEGLLKLDLAV